MASVLDDSSPMDRTMKTKTDFRSRFCIDQNRHSRSMLTKPSAWANCPAFRNPLPVTRVGDCPPSGEADEAVLYGGALKGVFGTCWSWRYLVKAEVLAFGFMYGCKPGLAHYSSHEPRRHHGRHYYHRFRRSLLVKSSICAHVVLRLPLPRQPTAPSPRATDYSKGSAFGHGQVQEEDVRTVGPRTTTEANGSQREECVQVTLPSTRVDVRRIIRSSYRMPTAQVVRGLLKPYLRKLQ